MGPGDDIPPDDPDDEAVAAGSSVPTPGAGEIAGLVGSVADAASRARSDASAGRGGLRVVGGQDHDGMGDGRPTPPPPGGGDGGGDSGSDGAGHGPGGRPDEPSDEQRRALLDTTDLGIALRMEFYAAGRALFTDSLGWLVYDGQRFDAEAGEALAHREILHLRDKMKSVEYPALKAWVKPALQSEEAAERQKARAALSRLWSAAVKLGNFSKQVSALKQAAVLDSFLVPFASLDAEYGAFNTRGGVLRFPLDAPTPIEGEVMADPKDTLSDITLDKHKPEDRITRVAAATPSIVRLLADEDDCPVWRAHLRRVFPGDPEKLRLFQRICGSFLVAHNPRQRWFIFQGEGGDGKSTTMAPIRAIMGDYFRTGGIDTLLHDGRTSPGGTREDLMRLVGATRLVLFPEPNHNQVLDGNFIKTITGGEQISARGGYGKQAEYDPQFKIVLMCNPRPKVLGDDDGFWRRPIFVRFPYQFTEAEKDPDIIAKLMAERDGILGWMIEGYADWRARGFFFDEPDNVRADITAYRRESSLFASWAQDRIIWGRWWDHDALSEPTPARIWRRIKDGEATPEEFAHARANFTTDDPERYPSPRWLPKDDIYADFCSWCDDGARDPWRPNAFSREFAAKARALGAKQAPRSGAKGRGWTHFDFVDGGPRVRDTGDAGGFRV